MFDFLDLKSKNWKEVKTRIFTPQECDAVESIEVVAGKYCKRACFTIKVNGETFVDYKSIEPIADVEIGQKLDPHDIVFVLLEYIGTDPNQKKKSDMKVRVLKATDKEEVNFDNPFGL